MIAVIALTNNLIRPFWYVKFMLPICCLIVLINIRFVSFRKQFERKTLIKCNRGSFWNAFFF